MKHTRKKQIESAPEPVRKESATVPRLIRLDRDLADWYEREAKQRGLDTMQQLARVALRHFRESSGNTV